MAAANRGRIWVNPLGSSKRPALALANTRSPGVRVGEIDQGHDDIYGWLTLLSNGQYVIEQVNGSIKSVDQRKAAAAHRGVEMPKPTDDQRADLAALVRSFVDETGLPVSRIAQMLGVPKRTLEGIVQGREFRYPQLLALAIQAFRSTPDGPK